LAAGEPAARHYADVPVTGHAPDAASAQQRDAADATTGDAAISTEPRRRLLERAGAAAVGQLR
jgi:hypothetical protein